MSTNTLILTFLFSLLYFPSNILAQPSKTCCEVSDDEIVALIPRSMDGPPDAKEIERYQKLINLGSKAYPALCAKLQETDDALLASSIISVLVESKGDKTLPRQTISKLVHKWNSQSENGKALLQQSAQAIGQIGTKDDAAILISLLDDPASSVRVNSLRSLTKLGDESVAQKVQTWFTTRKASMSETEQLRDPSIREAEKTVTIIQERLKKPTDSSLTK